MKTELLKLSCLALMLFTIFGCQECTDCENERDDTKDQLKETQLELEKCLADSEIKMSDDIYFNVVLSEDNNNDYQLIHIEGKYQLPYIILGKFKVKTVEKKCILQSITFKIKALDGKKYKFVKTPSYTYDRNSGYFKSTIDVELSSDAVSRDETLSSIDQEIAHKKILDVTVVNSKKLNEILQKEFGQEDDKSHWNIKCCGGAICKVKFDTGG